VDRFESANAFAQAASAPTPERGRGAKSIAVLPFGNLSADPENEYFCDGLTEAIINAFTTLKDLKVVARTSAFSFKGKDADVRDIGAQLDVSTVLEGSVQKAGARLRITAQLIDVANGYHLWSERFDRNMDDIFAIQDEISLAIADRLELKLLKCERSRLVKRHTDDPEAYNLYLKGRHFYSKRTKDGFDKSIDNFELALQKDPGFALSYAGLADTYLGYAFYEFMSLKEACQKAKQMALRAIDMDDSLGEAHTSLGSVLTWHEYDWEGGGREYREALELNPSEAEAHHHYAHYLSILGRSDEALVEMNKALELEPLSVNLNACLGQTLYFARRSDEAIEKLEGSIEIDPSFPLQYVLLGKAYLQQGMHEAALGALEKAATYPSIHAMASSGLAYAYAITGNTEKARSLLRDLLAQSEAKPVDQVFMAVVYTGLGETDRALDWLHEAYHAGSMHLPTVGVEYYFDRLREQPRFMRLVEKLGLDR
jgi:TolB-like protein/Tfp pilus assembly protein PilF